MCQVLSACRVSAGAPPTTPHRNRKLRSCRIARTKPAWLCQGASCLPCQLPRVCGVHTRVFPLGLVKLLGPEHSHSKASRAHGYPSAMASGGPSASSASPVPLTDPLAMLEAAYGPSIFESVVRCRHCKHPTRHCLGPLNNLIVDGDSARVTDAHHVVMQDGAKIPDDAWEYHIRKALNDAAYQNLEYVPYCSTMPVRKACDAQPKFMWVSTRHASKAVRTVQCVYTRRRWAGEARQAPSGIEDHMTTCLAQKCFVHVHCSALQKRKERH